MYQGEVNVAQDDLNSFLAVAEELKVKGLTQGTDSQSQPRQPAEVKSFKPEKKNRLAQAQSVAEDDDIHEVIPVKAEPAGNVEPQYDSSDPREGAVVLDDSYQGEAYDYESYNDMSGPLDPNTGMPFADGNKGMSML